MKEIAEHWLIAAQDDLLVLERIMPDERLSHMAAFHAQQCIEKSLKAIIEEHALGHIRTHNLARLFEIVRPHAIFDVDVILIEKMDKLYIDARYPGELGLLPDGKPTMADAHQFCACARSVHEQVEKALGSGPKDCR